MVVTCFNFKKIYIARAIISKYNYEENCEGVYFLAFIAGPQPDLY